MWALVGFSPIVALSSAQTFVPAMLMRAAPTPSFTPGPGTSSVALNLALRETAVPLVFSPLAVVWVVTLVSLSLSPSLPQAPRPAARPKDRRTAVRGRGVIVTAIDVLTDLGPMVGTLHWAQ